MAPPAYNVGTKTCSLGTVGSNGKGLNCNSNNHSRATLTVARTPLFSGSVMAEPYLKYDADDSSSFFP